MDSLWLLSLILNVIFVKEILSFTISSSGSETRLTANVGQSVIMDCPIHYPRNVVIPHTLQWRKDGELIFSESNGVKTFGESYVGRITSLPESVILDSGYGKGSVNVTNVRDTDQGWYQCRVVFPNRTPSTKGNGTWFHLEINGGNLLAIPPTNETVAEGENAKMRCVSLHPEKTVEWFKDGVPLDSVEPSLRERTRVAPEGTLSIVAAIPRDSGYYYCRVGDQSGEKQSAGAFLDVRYKAKVWYAPEDVYLPYGRAATLECHYRANPQATKVRWDKDGFLFDAYNVPGVYTRPNGTLYFSKVDESHSGEYTCTPHNELGSAGPSPVMNVVVQKPPTFAVIPHLFYIRKLGESVSMVCDAVDGHQYRKPTIAWIKRNGAEMPRNRSTIVGGNLTIVDIKEEDEGHYQCVASNEAASVSSDVELMIERAQTLPVTNLSADANETSIRLKWRKPAVVPKIEFSVWYRTVDTPEWRTLKVNSSFLTEISIGNLSPGKDYEVMVLSQDRNGDGLFSKSITVRTPELVEAETEFSEEGATESFNTELSMPQEIKRELGEPLGTYVEMCADGFRVHWRKPSYGADLVKYYTIVWYKFTNEERPEGTEKTSDTHFTIGRLDEGNLYSVDVYATSANEYESSRARYLYYVPQFHTKAGLAIGAASAIAFVASVVFVTWYCKKTTADESSTCE